MFKPALYLWGELGVVELRGGRNLIYRLAISCLCVVYCCLGCSMGENMLNEFSHQFFVDAAGRK